MTDQEIFDKVVTHLLTQNARSTDGRKCLYRGPNGNKCAAGCLIDDEHYNPSLENKSALSADVEVALLSSGIPAGALSLVGSLQSIHDVYPASVYSDRLGRLASERGLKFNPPQTT
jgi:hypothetical protein